MNAAARLSDSSLLLPCSFETKHIQALDGFLSHAFVFHSSSTGATSVSLSALVGMRSDMIRLAKAQYEAEARAGVWPFQVRVFRHRLREAKGSWAQVDEVDFCQYPEPSQGFERTDCSSRDHKASTYVCAYVCMCIIHAHNYRHTQLEKAPAQI